MMKYFWIALGAVCGFALGFAVGFYKGGSAKEAYLLSQGKSQQIEVYKDGKKIDENVLSATDSALCDYLGGCELQQDNGGSH